MNAVDGPASLQVSAWADRKERNIRALLSSLHEILWEGETRWTPVGMHKLVQPDQVSPTYVRTIYGVLCTMYRGIHVCTICTGGVHNYI